MSGPIGSQQWMYNASSGFYPYEINNSLKFELGDNAYLSRTPASAGNRRTWTWSGWIKRADISNDNHTIWRAYGTSGNTGDYILINNNDELQVGTYSGGHVWRLTSTNKLRDSASWYHIVALVDTTQSTSSNRAKLYINGEVVTAFTNEVYPSLNYQTLTNTADPHYIGYRPDVTDNFSGYLAEVNFIDGSALTPSSFGETKEGIWIPKEPTGLTYGTNGFYLPFKETTTANGFNTVLATGKASTQSLDGVGFQPDLVWLKVRNSSVNHILYDSVRGVQKYLVPNLTNTEATNAQGLTSFDSDGFTLGTINPNSSTSYDFVAWCWDAGTGSAASNSNGTIPSTVKANQDYGFSVVSYTGNGSDGATVGHGLSQTPEFILIKKRANNSGGNTGNWIGQHVGLATDPEATSSTFTLSSYTNGAVYLNLNNAQSSYGFDNQINGNTDTFVAYCFHSVSGYQKVGSYSGTNSANNSITGLGFKPAWLMIKRTDSADDWCIYDNTRYPGASTNTRLEANDDAGEVSASSIEITFDNDGFTLVGDNSSINASGTYIYLAIADTRDALFTSDASGNGNNWTPNDLQHSDVMPDTPTDGFAVLNNLSNSSGGGTLKEGNLIFKSHTSGWESKVANIGITSGKWYFEGVTNLSVGNSIFGLSRNPDTYLNQYLGYYSNTWGYYLNNGKKYNNGTATTYGSTATNGDVIGIAFDADAGTLTFYKNNVSQGVAFTGLTTLANQPNWFLGCSSKYYSGNYTETTVNFGQDSSFNGTKIPQGNTDDNGKGDFFYTPPSGYLALCNANLPDPAIDPNKGENPEDYFNTVFYSGNSGSGNAVTGVGFQPDWTWVKSRNTTGEQNKVVDSLRGAGLTVFPSSASAEIDYSGGVGFDSFDADGFTVSHSAANNQWNVSGRTYIAWNWLAGGTAVTNNDGSIQSTVSANTEAGFSIVSYTGTGSAGTIGHGLNSAPEMVIIKSRTGAVDWIVLFNVVDGSWDYMRLNTTAAKSDTTIFNADADTLDFSASSSLANTSGSNYICYCFSSKQGYSKFSRYTGNTDDDGPFVYTGFRPSFVMVKRAVTSSTGSWAIVDSKRAEYNPETDALLANLQLAESTGYLKMDLLSNGFKLRDNGGTTNTSGDVYIYMAFAEQPFKYSNAR